MSSNPTQTYISVIQASLLLNLVPSRVRRLCQEGRIQGARREGYPDNRASWVIPCGPGGPVLLDHPRMGGRPPKAVAAAPDSP